MGATVQEDSRNSGSGSQSAPTLDKHQTLPTIALEVRLAQLLKEFVRNPYSALLLPENELESSSFLKGLKNVQLPEEITEKYDGTTTIVWESLSRFSMIDCLPTACGHRARSIAKNTSRAGHCQQLRCCRHSRTSGRMSLCYCPHAPLQRTS